MYKQLFFAVAMAGTKCSVVIAETIAGSSPSVEQVHVDQPRANFSNGQYSNGIFVFSEYIPYVNVVSPSDKSCIHSYHDVSPESPNSNLVAFFCWDANSEIEGWLNGGVWLYDNESGTIRRVPAEIRGSSHEGALEFWLSDSLLAFRSGISGYGRTTILDVRNDSSQDIPTALRSYSSANDIAIASSTEFSKQTRLKEPLSIVRVPGPTADSEPTIVKEEIDVTNLQNSARGNVSDLSIKHPKWNRDGSKLLAVIYHSSDADDSSTQAVVIMDESGGVIREYSGIGHHPVWLNDSQSFAIFHGNRGSSTLDIYDVNSGRRMERIGPIVGTHLAAHPNGNIFAWDRLNHPRSIRTEFSTIQLLERDTGKISNVAIVRFLGGNVPGKVHPHPVFSIDGERLYFNGIDSNGLVKVYEVNVGHGSKDL